MADSEPTGSTMADSEPAPYLFGKPPLVDPASKDSSTAFPFEGCDIQTVSEETIISLLDQCPILHQYGGTKIVRISQKLILKSGGGVLPSEAETMRLVAANTSIRIPKVYRSFNVPSDGYFDTTGYIVMDYVEGIFLANCWNALDSTKRQHVISQVAGMIQQLQSVQLDIPGPIGGGPSQGKWFTHYSAGPFKTRREIENWFNYKLTISKMYGWAKQDTPLFDFPIFVLTHQDITPRNLILDTSDQIWMIDWEWAGAYPPYFETATFEWGTPFKDFNQELLAQIRTDRQVHTDPQKISELLSIGMALDFAPMLRLSPEDPFQIYRGDQMAR